MADVADIAEVQIEHALRESIRSASQIKGLLPVGRCHFCDEAISHGIFCPPVDSSGDGCFKDYEHHQRLKKIARGR